MNYLILLLVGLAVIIFIVKVKNFDSFLYRVLYIGIGFVIIVGIVVLLQPDDYIKYNSDPKTQSQKVKNKEKVSQIQYLALKMRSEGFTEEQIVESFFHEYSSNLNVASDLEKANFSLKTIQKFFKYYKNSEILENRKLSKEEYSRHLIEQDIKRFASFSSEDKSKIREMEKNKVSIAIIKKKYPNYKPNDEVKAIDLGKFGKSLSDIKKIFPNYEPKKY